MTSPLVSVVIPTRNRRQLLGRALNTVCGQRDVHFEIVVVDDGSTDDTPDFLASLADHGVRTIRHEVGGGVARARNAGIDAARGEWISFLDDDDVWAPDKLSAQLGALATDRSAQWACTGAVVVNPELAVIGAHLPPPTDGDVASLFLAENRLGSGSSCVVARASLLRELRGFDDRLAHLADYDLWIRLALASRLVSVNRGLMAYVVHPAGQGRVLGGWSAEHALLLEKFAEEAARRGVTPKLDYWWRWEAEQSARAGRRGAALRANARILRRYRHWSWIPMMLAMAVSPAALGIRQRRYRRLIPDGWPAEAEQWLAPLRSA